MCKFGQKWCKGPDGPGAKCLDCQKEASAKIGKPGGGQVPARPGVSVPTVPAKPGMEQAAKPPASVGLPKSPILPKVPVVPKSPVAAKSPASLQKPVAESQSSGYRWLGGGMDKGYYYKAGEKYGWLEFKDVEVMNKEVQAYQKLKPSISDYMPELNTKLAPPVNVVNQKQEVVQPVRGYWI